jgi:hypothetical protein
MKNILLLIICLMLSTDAFSQNVWINEVHYDNVGADTLEFVEIVLQNPGSYLLSDFTLTLYNGGNGSSYNTKTLDQYVFSQVDPNDNSFSYYYFMYPANGIQNGSPDGICLDYQGTVILFISYEGTFTAVGGPANGLLSTDIDVSESTSTPVGSSVGLTGNGIQYSDFTWAYFDGTATIGAPNDSQIIPVELSSFSAKAIDGNVTINWSTASELNNSGFEVQRAFEGKEFVTIGFVPGHGTTTEARSYRFVDAGLSAGGYTYRLKQIDFNGTFAYSDEVNAEVTSPVQFELAQNYPNPFNPSTTIKFSIPQNSNVTLKIFNTLGQEVKTLLNQNMESGVHTINFDASELNSGIYFYRLDAGQFSEVRKMTLIK